MAKTVTTNFEYFIGDTYERNFVVKKYTDDIDAVFFSVKKSNGDKRTVLQKTLDNGITLVDDVVVDSERQRTYQLMINAEDTEDMTPEQEYEFDVEIVTNKDDTDIKQTIITGNFILTNATTRIWNEYEGKYERY
jgi:hypothetical protein